MVQLSKWISIASCCASFVLTSNIRDRGTYDPNLQTAVNYTVPDPSQAPATLTYGPSFFSLANNLRGNVTIGLNRQLNNIDNVRSAITVAQKTVTSLLAIELGNEPDCLLSSFYS